MSRRPHAILLLGILGFFAALALVTPRAVGFGTHEALGLPPCLFRALFSLPCPTCGITTSLAAVIHGDFALALRAHPAGLFSLLAALGLFVGGLYGLIYPFPWGRFLGHRWFHRGTIVVIGALVGAWGVRLATSLG